MIVEDNLNQEESANQSADSNVENVETPQISIRTVDENFVEPVVQFEQNQEQQNNEEEQGEQGNENEEQQSQDDLSSKSQQEEAVTPVIEIDDEKAIAYLKSKGIEVNSFEDLKPKEVQKLSPEVEKFIEFTKETGSNNYQDFLETQKDWSQVSEQERIIQKLKIDYPNLDNEDIELMFEDKYGYDEDIDDERTIRLRKLNLKVDSQDALKTLEQRKEKFKVNRGSEDLVPQEYKTAKQIVDQQKANEEVYLKKYEDFVKATESVFTKDFEGFKYKVGNEELVLKPSNLELSKKEQLDIVNFQKKYFDNDSNIKDPKGYHKALYAAMNPDKFAEHFFNLGKASYAEQEDKESKNISMESGTRRPPANQGKIVVRPV
jgi:hypothetical protein